MTRLAWGWLALVPALALAQESSPQPAPSESPPAYRVQPPPAPPGQKVAVRDRFEVTLQLGAREPKVESGYAQAFEDTWLPPDRGRHQLDALRVYREGEDLSGKLSDPALPGFELRWGRGATGLFFCHNPTHELSALLFELQNTEHAPEGLRNGELNMPAGVIPAIPVMVGQSWDVDPTALARWGQVLWGNALIPVLAQGHLAAASPGKSGPVLDLRWSLKLTVSRFHPPEVSEPVNRPTAVRVEVKVSQPTVWEVDGDPYVVETRGEGSVQLESCKRYQVERRWRREVRRLE